MYSAPQIEPVTTMARNHKALLEKLKDGPVFLTQRGTEAAVMVSAAEWRSITRQLVELEELRRQARLDRSLRAYEAWVADPERAITQEQFDQMLAEAGLR
jgi:prevent-host-death family protein